MAELLVLTGTCGVDKTTVARAWAARRRGAAVHGDHIRLWIRHRELRRARSYQHQFVVNTAVAATDDLLSQGVDVAIDFVWLPAGIEQLRTTFSSRADMRFVWLRCRPDENRRRDLLRPADCVMGPRVDELLLELDAMIWPDYVARLDTTGWSVDDTIAAIQEVLVMSGPSKIR